MDLLPNWRLLAEAYNINITNLLDDFAIKQKVATAFFNYQVKKRIICY
jgi:hypothetical protein